MIITNSREMINEIVKFLEEKFPHFLQTSNEYFRIATVKTIMDFIEKKEKDFVNYPWGNKIFEKRRKLYGF